MSEWFRWDCQGSLHLVDDRDLFSRLGELLEVLRLEVAYSNVAAQALMFEIYHFLPGFVEGHRILAPE